ncbi:DUF1905 domain-containing protein [Flagellimonas hymeniacidonis]|uniref:DUF1905 domain-containing protein n=1 Tax=Flagellimonas hymeniacidonis TaxID=2603628 RepID=A0A5C8V0R2_9FLAO|nr:YdeI/OmpD-associated family protein [Flagellimonas hymeniacidonis]TXN35363.1 DUF1905 domain-containing protein [Flagellimonas hymeniacidonis]
MNKEKPLLDKEYLLQKFPGKGGWMYASIPEILQSKNTPFGWVKVKGSIDGHPLNQYKLMPMGNGKLFLPVKAEIRKKIKKEAGDYVHVVLFPDNSSIEIPEDIIACFKNEPPELLETFSSFTEGQQKAYLDWVYAAKTEGTKASRIVKMMDRLTKNLKFYEKQHQD